MSAAIDVDLRECLMSLLSRLRGGVVFKDVEKILVRRSRLTMLQPHKPQRKVHICEVLSFLMSGNAPPEQGGCGNVVAFFIEPSGKDDTFVWSQLCYLATVHL